LKRLILTDILEKEKKLARRNTGEFLPLIKSAQTLQFEKKLRLTSFERYKLDRKKN